MQDDWTFAGEEGLSNTGWQSFPYLREIRLRTTSGIEPVTAIGVESIAALEEVLVDFQEVEFQMLAQPTSVCKALWSKALRSGSMHLPFLGVRVLLPSTETEAVGLEIQNCIASRADFEQPTDGPATLRMTLSGGYVRVVPLTSQSQMDNFVAAMSYNTSAGIILIREGTITITEQGSQTPLIAPMRVASFSLRINNRLEALHTFQDFTGLTTDNLQAIRLWNALYEGRAEYTGTLTAYVYPLPKSITAAKVPVVDMTLNWYPLVGQSQPTVGNPELTITVTGARFRSVDVPATPDRPVALDVEYEAVSVSIS